MFVPDAPETLLMGNTPYLISYQCAITDPAELQETATSSLTAKEQTSVQSRKGKWLSLGLVSWVVSQQRVVATSPPALILAISRILCF